MGRHEVPGGVRTAVALFVFNRPAETARVLEAVAAVRPRRLLVVADGPRQGRHGEEEVCARVRSLFDRIDWECEVERHFSAVNLGCGRRVSTGLAWVFSRTEEAIVLEDDCLAHPSFFPFCDALLERYRDEPRVMQIAGVNFQGGKWRGDGSYYFSGYPHVWGWASWRRAFQHYDFEMTAWPQARAGRFLRQRFPRRASARYWRMLFDKVQRGEIDTWDYQWAFAIWQRDGLVATPNVNLVTNIGAGPGGTHTTEAGALFDRPSAPLPLPLSHPLLLERDLAADEFVQANAYEPDLASRVRELLRNARKGLLTAKARYLPW
jgi:hypothetical protein